MTQRSLVLLALVATLTACDADTASSADATAADATTDATHHADVTADAGLPALVDTVAATFEVRPGVESVTIVGAEPKVPLTLYRADGQALITMVTDDFGQCHFAYAGNDFLTIESGDGTEIPVADGYALDPGDGYVLRRDDLDPPAASAPFSILAIEDVPDPTFYDDQPLTGFHFGILGLGDGETELDGFNYVTMRDGVKLSATVRFPDPILYGDGPYPVVIEYSGYSTSRPDSPDPGSNIATLLGYASVGVNMRGTGCSGGVFDVFNPAQHADGYDLVEVVARQPWALHGHVGMVGLSYSGIAQLFVAYTQPPSLAAITPQSVLEDPWEELWPGGIYNDGFTRQWLAQRDSSAASGGQSWTAKIIEGGDAVCEEHQVLRHQNIAFETFFKLLEFYPDEASARSLPLLVGDINVPVYLAGAFQDEQTGAQFGDMLDRFTGAPVTKFTLYNGRHPDGYSPLVLTRWFEFLEFYVARRIPRLDDVIRDLAGPELAKVYGVQGLGFEADRFVDFSDDQYDQALAAYEAEPDVRVLFESGAAGPEPGAPLHRFEATWPSWPPPDAVGRSFYLGPDGALTDAAPGGAGGADTFRHDPDAGGTSFFGPKGYQMMKPLWDLGWTPFAADLHVAYVTEPLAEDVVVAGPGWAELWMTSEVDDVQVQVTITEVHPDDTEFLVQSGWLRLGHRAFEEVASDPFRIARGYGEAAFQPLTPGEYVAARVSIPSVAHAFRAGSRLRVVISAPGRDHGTWEFAPPPSYAADASPRHSVAFTPDKASRLFLPVVSGVPVAAGLPPCPSLRGQPCRTYAPSANTAGEAP